MHSTCFSAVAQALTTSTCFAELLPGSGGLHCRHDASLLLLAAVQRCAMHWAPRRLCCIVSRLGPCTATHCTHGVPCSLPSTADVVKGISLNRVSWPSHPGRLAVCSERASPQRSELVRSPGNLAYLPSRQGDFPLSGAWFDWPQGRCSTAVQEWPSMLGWMPEAVHTEWGWVIAALTA